MKKILLALLLALVLVAPASARQVGKEILAETILTVDDNGSTTSTATFTGDADRIAFFVDYTESQNTLTQVVLNLYVSYDNENWSQGYWYDYDGGTTLQSVETLTAEGWYYMWWNKDLTVPYAKITLTPTLSTSADRASITVYSVMDK